MKAVLIAIPPKWCELIASGKKTVEIRKTRPKLDTPFKVYIYCTNSKPILGRCLKDNSLKETPEIDFDNYNRDILYKANGKVIGEFVCDRIYNITPHFDKPDFCNQYLCDWNWGEGTAHLSFTEMNDYLKGKNGYGWHISNFVMYDKPKDLSEFCSYNVRAYFDEELKLPMPTHEIKRPPQSWCYCEELKDGA